MQTLAPADNDVTVRDWVAVFGAGRADGRAPTLSFAGQSSSSTAECAAGVSLFDGVLYNRADLMRELGLDDRASDAPIVLRAFERWGHECAAHLKGLFAFVVWDRAEDRLLAVRDPLGAYPLFHASDRSGRLLLSTSIDALVRAGADATINRAALADHLSHRWPYPTETFYSAVSRVPPGCRLVVTRTGRRVERYWDPAPVGEPVNWVTEDELETFDARFGAAVTRAMDQGRTGIFLSGGLDSISVAAFAADAAGRSGRAAPIALSLGFPHPECDEELVQRGVAGALGLEQEFVPFYEAVPSRQLLGPALEYTRTSPAPMLNTWSPAYTELALRGKRRGVQVIMTGAGGDEWLTVSPYLAADLIRRGDLAGLAQFMRAWQRSYRLSPWRVLRGNLWTFGIRPLAGAGLDRIAPRAWHRNRLARLRATTRPWVAPDPTLKAEIDRRTEDALTPASPAAGFYFQEVRAGLDHPLTSMELEEIFEMGRRLGVRFRHPYWDADVVDLLYRTPPRLLSRNGRAKSLVRDTVARRFPRLGLERQKKIAGTSFFRQVLRDEIPKLWKNSGGAPHLAALGVVDAARAQAMVDASLSEFSREGLSRIWDLVNLDAWVQAHTTGTR